MTRRPISTGLRVLILNQYARPSGSAGITRHGDIGAELLRRGHQVSVIASDFDYLARTPQRGPARSIHGGVDFVWLRTGTYVGNDQRRVRSMVRFGYASTWSAVRMRPRPDVIVGSSPNLLAGGAADAASRLLRRPWILEVRDFWPSSLVDLGAVTSGSLTHKVLERIELRLYRDADAVVSVPPNGARRLEEVGSDTDKVTHIPNAADGTDNEGIATDLPETIRMRLARPDHGFLVVYTGALGVAQDLPTVLAAADALQDEVGGTRRDIRLLLVGDGVERERIASEVIARRLGNVGVEGPVVKGAVRQVLAAADACLVHLANADVFKYGLSPNKLFDYFAAGKPVLIASNHPTIVEEAGAGIRYRPGDPLALADAIRRMAALSDEERAEMGRRGRHLVETRYSIGAITDQYEALLEEVVARHRAR